MKTLNKKQIIINSSILIAGIFLGWLLFGGKKTVNHNSQLASRNSQPTTWTCSMHPQIKQPDAGDCPICGMDLIPMVSASENSNPAQIEMSTEAMKLANIQTSLIEFSSTEKEIYLQGKVEIDERRVSTQAIHFSGRIEKLYVGFEGEKVYKGQKLAKIYSPQLVTAQKELFEAIKTKESYPKLYEAARNKLKLWKLSDKQILEIETRGTVQDKFEVLADVSGYVSKKKVSVGDYLKAGDVLFELVDLSRLWILFDAYEKDLAFIKVGNRINFTVSSLPSKTFSAKISYIDPMINPQKRTASLRTEVQNSGMLLKPEMFVNGKLIAELSHKKDALVVPKSAIMWTGKRSIVYVKVPDTETPIFELRVVELGEVLGDLYVVISGVEKGDEVVTNGAFTVDAAAQLNSKYSMMNPPITKDTANKEDSDKTIPEKIKTEKMEMKCAPGKCGGRN